MNDDDGVMLSESILNDLGREPLAVAALVGLVGLHQRRRFVPKVEDFPGSQCWRGRGSRQKFARAIALLHVEGYLRWFPNGRYQITDRILTVAEYRRAYPDAVWRNGVSWPSAEDMRMHDERLP